VTDDSATYTVYLLVLHKPTASMTINMRITDVLLNALQQERILHESTSRHVCDTHNHKKTTNYHLSVYVT